MRDKNNVAKLAKEHANLMWKDPALKRQRNYAEHSFTEGFKASKKIANERIKTASSLPIGDVMHWALVVDGKYPLDRWLYLVTSDEAHHIAYYSSKYDKWISNSKFGGEPKWWAEKVQPPSA